jgi:hypothetical protein
MYSIVFQIILKLTIFQNTFNETFMKINLPLTSRMTIVDMTGLVFT